MLNYLKAENLKCKRTFAKKLVIIAPVLMLILAFLSGRYFVVNGYNWWYILILPGFITLLSALVNQYEEKRLRYRAVFALSVDLKKIWISKVVLIGIYVSAANLLHLAGILFGMSAYNTNSGIAAYQAIAASAILIATELWQIPLCLFLSKKFGLMAAVFLNLGGGTVLKILMAAKSYWWACPYSWSSRLMCPVLGILPQGIMAEAGDPMLNSGVVPVGILLSIAFFVLLLLITTLWFPKQEVK
ncbi:MAG: lantibiotic transport system permease protein [Clostridiales bacterium]|jgi:ABC-2 type transport system permease protein|nr:antibiotic transport system permease protein [Oscillospiraceae bacterium]MDN5378576.1 lantibiotic transport system permease protein [Clostridiales bacterium]